MNLILLLLEHYYNLYSVYLLIYHLMMDWSFFPKKDNNNWHLSFTNPGYGTVYSNGMFTRDRV